jgi:hypothetical protein
MRRTCSILLVMLAGGSPLVAQTPTPPPPQSARQALIEMFLGKGADAFAKHLPEAARRTLIRKGETPETSVALRISTIGRQVVASGQHLETFETGPILLVSESANEKIEVMVEHDILLGEQDEIELSFQYYKNGQLQSLPVVPRITFTFQQEKEIWRLAEITAAAHVPLTDPDYLKSLRKQQDESYESAAQTRLTMIAAAENRYSMNHPDRGYTCTLPDLFAKDPETASGENGYTYDPGQGNDEWNGYRFALSGCDGTPASTFRITATPADADSDMKTFCTDESGGLKFLSSGKSSACFSRGKPVGTD